MPGGDYALNGFHAGVLALGDGVDDVRIDARDADRYDEHLGAGVDDEIEQVVMDLNPGNANARILDHRDVEHALVAEPLPGRRPSGVNRRLLWRPRQDTGQGGWPGHWIGAGR